MMMKWVLGEIPICEWSYEVHTRLVGIGWNSTAYNFWDQGDYKQAAYLTWIRTWTFFERWYVYILRHVLNYLLFSHLLIFLFLTSQKLHVLPCLVLSCPALPCPALSVRTCPGVPSLSKKLHCQIVRSFLPGRRENEHPIKLNDRIACHSVWSHYLNPLFHSSPGPRPSLQCMRPDRIYLAVSRESRIRKPRKSSKPKAYDEPPEIRELYYNKEAEQVISFGLLYEKGWTWVCPYWPSSTLE